MPQSESGNRAPRNYLKYKLISYPLAVLVAMALLEVAVRLHYSPVQILYLPYYGLSSEQHNFLIWKNRPEKNSLSTATTPYSFDEYNAKLGWKVKSNAEVKHLKPGLWKVDISTNSFGLRGDSPKYQRNTSNTIRVGFIGASQTFGESVNDSEVYVSILDKMLGNIEVLNFGVRGYGTDQMLLYYEDEAKKYDLDVTVLAFAFHHIPRNVSGFTFYAKPYFIKSNRGLDLFGAPVPSEFDLFDKEIEDSKVSLLNKSILMRYVLKKFRSLNEYKFYDKEGDGWSITKLIITQFAKVVEQNNSHFILLNTEHNYPVLEPELEKLANQLGIDIINLGPTIRELLASGVAAQIPNDNHWSSIGHKHIAEAIYTDICRKYECK